MSPRWLHWPDAVGGLTLDISGTFDTAAGTGARDADPTFTIPSGTPTGLQYIEAREGSIYGLSLQFDSTANRDAFLSAYPSDFAPITYRDTLNNVDVITISGWSWDISVGGRATLLATTGSQWVNWQTVSSDLATSSHTYTITA